jgi:hypothetical protein
LSAQNRDVRYSTNSGKKADITVAPLCASSGHEAIFNDELAPNPLRAVLKK